MKNSIINPTFELRALTLLVRKFFRVKIILKDSIFVKSKIKGFFQKIENNRNSNNFHEIKANDSSTLLYMLARFEKRQGQILSERIKAIEVVCHLNVSSHNLHEQRALVNITQSCKSINSSKSSRKAIPLKKILFADFS